MFWNSEFLNASTSQLDVLLQMQTVKLSDILFEEDLLQELKTSNINLANFLTKPEVVAELVDNITQLTETDCCDKSLYSKVHAAYISCEILTSGSSEIFAALMNHPDSLNKILSCLTTVIPQKAALVSKLISTIHSLAATNLSCHMTQDFQSFSNLIDLLLINMDISGSFEILCTFMKPTMPPESRHVFCELLSKLNFVNSLIDVMTMSDFEDKQRNACQLLCDIIVVGRQVASEQQNDSGLMAQDMLLEIIESNQATCKILQQMFSHSIRNTTAIVCGMKVIQTLLEQKSANDAPQIAKTIEKLQGEIEKHLINFHELLLNPPKQEPIKTTFGLIQKPLGYMRLEVVNYIRALLSTNSSGIIGKLIELKTLKVIIDLFIEYSWNNLLHTQVEQALCLIIKNCRHDEEQEQEKELGEVKKVQPEVEIPSRALLSQLLNECDLIGRLLLTPNQQQNQPKEQDNEQSEQSKCEKEENEERSENHNNDADEKVKEQPEVDNNITNNSTTGTATTDRQRRRNGEMDNFGHIVQMINSIAINRDLDTIRDHLSIMRENRPELYDKWTTFVNVDVASFKAKSLYYDALPADVEDQFYSYISFTTEDVLPKINIDVLPRLRKSKNAHQ